MISGGLFPARRALAIRTRTVDINVLMVIAVVGAVALGDLLEAASVVFLFAVAQWLEVRTLERASGYGRVCRFRSRRVTRCTRAASTVAARSRCAAARDAFDLLRTQGMRRIAMLTGDRAESAAAVAEALVELLKLPYALRFARATLRNVKTNVVVSLLLKARVGDVVDGGPC